MAELHPTRSQAVCLPLWRPPLLSPIKKWPQYSKMVIHSNQQKSPAGPRQEWPEPPALPHRRGPGLPERRPRSCPRPSPAQRLTAGHVLGTSGGPLVAHSCPALGADKELHPNLERRERGGQGGGQRASTMQGGDPAAPARAPVPKHPFRSCRSHLFPETQDSTPPHPTPCSLLRVTNAVVGRRGAGAGVGVQGCHSWDPTAPSGPSPGGGAAAPGSSCRRPLRMGVGGLCRPTGSAGQGPREGPRRRPGTGSRSSH